MCAYVLANTRIIVGIDPGTQTGIAIYDTQKRNLLEVHSTQLWQAAELVLHYKKEYPKIVLVIEDPNQKLGKMGRTEGRHMGAGHAKQSYKNWVQFAEYYHIPLVPVRTIGWEKYKKQTTDKPIFQRDYAHLSCIKNTTEHSRMAILLTQKCSILSVKKQENDIK